MRSRVALAVVTLATLGACDGYDPNSCKPLGAADVDGMVKSMPLGPFVRAEQAATNQTVGPPYAIVFHEVAGACGETAPTGTNLVFLFCDPPEERSYEIGSEQYFHCPTADALALIEKDGGEDVAVSTAGTLTIEHAGGCLYGTYAATFGVDELVGTFDAVVCP
ncbi:hypothetical protein BH11MYX3_BH11MYX3_46960 [soil metagenome]